MKLLKVIKKRMISKRDEWLLAEHQVKWRSLNNHNHTNAGRVFPIDKVSVGNQTYGTLNVLSYENDQERLEIGNFCSIATNTYFILSGEHRFDTLSSFPFQKVMMKGPTESICKGPIKICDDVWIGYGCIILSGVTIGQGAVIGAGSVVAKDVPPYSIFVNNHVLKYRFSDSVISSLRKADFSNLKTDLSENDLEYFNISINENNVDDVISHLFDCEVGVEASANEGT